MLYEVITRSGRSWSWTWFLRGSGAESGQGDEIRRPGRVEPARGAVVAQVGEPLPREVTVVPEARRQGGGPGKKVVV